MRQQIKECFREAREITPEVSWEEASSLCSVLPRGWFELTRIEPQGRLEFVEQFWLHQLREEPALCEEIPRFFAQLDNLILFITEKSEPYLVYSLRRGGFFSGQIPLGSTAIEAYSFFRSWPLPRSYLAFQAIHGRFHKGMDIGLFAVCDVAGKWGELQEEIRARSFALDEVGPLDSAKLIPFYQSFGGNYWHCFYAEWFPNEMGCCTIRADTKGSVKPTFASFSEWLATYLVGEGIDVLS